MGCRPSASFAGSVGTDHRQRVETAGQWQLNEEAGAGGVGVGTGDDVLDLLLRRGGGQFALEAADADRGAVTMLPATYARLRIVAHQQGAQTGRAPGGEPRPGRPSALMLAAVALPSRIRAATPHPGRRPK